VLKRVSKRRELSTAIGLTLSGRIYKRHFGHTIHGDDVVVFLKHLHRFLPGPMQLLWDRLGAHRSRAVKDYLEAHPEIMMNWLPPYAPDLNPEEGCHGNVKQHLRNATPEIESEIRHQVDREFARLRRRPDVLLRFFRHAGLRVKRLT
jgi:transposase